jgi:MarR family transcriptional regulator, 2-MHQ and catechol-resistance regulon repressor
MAGLQINQLHTFGLTQGQFRALEALLHSGPLSQAAVSERMFCGQSNVSYITERLRRRGLIVQLVNEDDRRGKLMHLTPEGRRLISKVFLLHATLIRAQMSVLDARELETLFRMCVKLGNGDAVKLLREMMSGNESENWMKAMGEARLEERVRGAG